MKKKFSNLLSSALIFDRDDVDTDLIIPARFLKRTARNGFGDALFYDLRFDDAGNERKDSPLKEYSGTEKILITGKNFGCGSSREHAAWALRDSGFEVIIAASFADIFYNNAPGSGILPVVLGQQQIRELKYRLAGDKNLLHVDLEKQEISVPGTAFIISFHIDAHTRQKLLSGSDDTALLLAMKNQIIHFESSRNAAKFL